MNRSKRASTQISATFVSDVNACAGGKHQFNSTSVLEAVQIIKSSSEDFDKWHPNVKVQSISNYLCDTANTNVSNALASNGSTTATAASRINSRGEVLDLCDSDEDDASLGIINTSTTINKKRNHLSTPPRTKKKGSENINSNSPAKKKNRRKVGMGAGKKGGGEIVLQSEKSKTQGRTAAARAGRGPSLSGGDYTLGGLFPGGASRKPGQVRTLAPPSISSGKSSGGSMTRMGKGSQGMVPFRGSGYVLGGGGATAKRQQPQSRNKKDEIITLDDSSDEEEGMNCGLGSSTSRKGNINNRSMYLTSKAKDMASSIRDMEKAFANLNTSDGTPDGKQPAIGKVQLYQMKSVHAKVREGVNASPSFVTGCIKVYKNTTLVIVSDKSGTIADRLLSPHYDGFSCSSIQALAQKGVTQHGFTFTRYEEGKYFPKDQGWKVSKEERRSFLSSHFMDKFYRGGGQFKGGNNFRQGTGCATSMSTSVQALHEVIADAIRSSGVEKTDTAGILKVMRATVHNFSLFLSPKALSSSKLDFLNPSEIAVKGTSSRGGTKYCCDFYVCPPSALKTARNEMDVLVDILTLLWRDQDINKSELKKHMDEVLDILTKGTTRDETDSSIWKPDAFFGPPKVAVYGQNNQGKTVWQCCVIGCTSKDRGGTKGCCAKHFRVYKEKERDGTLAQSMVGSE